MTSYSFWYLIIHHDWYLQNADLDFLEKHRAYILGLIDQIDAQHRGGRDGNLRRLQISRLAVHPK